MTTLSSSSNAMEKTIRQFATLLGTFYVKNNNNESNDKGEQNINNTTATTINAIALPCSKALSRLFVSNGVASSFFPSLSLKCAKTNHIHHHHDDYDSSSNKDEVEALASQNLLRPILIRKDHCPPDSAGAPMTENANAEPSSDEENEDDDENFTTDNIANVPRIMLNNVISSFSLLLDARLRAYTTFLTRHEVSMMVDAGEDQESILAVDRKLAMLVDMGTHTCVDTTVTAFNIIATQQQQQQQQQQGEEAPANNDEGANEEAKAEETGATTTTTDGEIEIKMPITMEAVMDISIPNFKGGKKCVTILIKTSGTIKGLFDSNSSSLLKLVHVDLDAHELLANMIDRAGLVMKLVVEIVNATCSVQQKEQLEKQVLGSTEGSTAEEQSSTQGEKEEEEEAEGENAPPAKKRKTLAAVSYENDDDDDDDGLPIVSPDLGANPDSPTPTPLKLNGGLTAEKCATIVDCAIGEEDFFCLGSVNNQSSILAITRSLPMKREK